MAYVHFKYTWLQCKFPYTFIWEGKKFPQISALNWFSWIVLYSIHGFCGSFFWIYFCICFLLSQLLNLEPWGFHAFKYFARAYSGPATLVLWPFYHRSQITTFISPICMNCERKTPQDKRKPAWVKGKWDFTASKEVIFVPKSAHFCKHHKDYKLQRSASSWEESLQTEVYKPSLPTWCLESMKQEWLHALSAGLNSKTCNTRCSWAAETPLVASYQKMSLTPYLYVAKVENQVLYNTLTKLLATQPTDETDSSL